MKKNLIVGQSGGPTAVINGSLYGVVTEAMRHTEEIDEIYGMINGIEGFLNGHMMDMRSLIETNERTLLTPYNPRLLPRVMSLQASRRFK